MAMWPLVGLLIAGRIVGSLKVDTGTSVRGVDLLRHGVQVGIDQVLDPQDIQRKIQETKDKMHEAAKNEDYLKAREYQKALEGLKLALITTTSTTTTTYTEPPSGPTTYSFFGCWDNDDFGGKPDVESSWDMTLERCFLHCKKQAISAFRPPNYFGVSQGKRCFCRQLARGKRVSDDACLVDGVKCSGDPAKKCGSLNNIASVYYMMDCKQTKAEEDVVRYRKNEGIIDSYAVFDDQTCGRFSDNGISVGGAQTRIASVHDCKLACWDEGFCHGFTWEAAKGKCTFHSDVMSGKIQKVKGDKCFMKKMGMENLEPGFPH